MKQGIAGPFWALLSALVLCWGMSSYPLIDPDEGRNAVIAQQMASSNNFLIPYLNGVPYLDKPFLYFAATAASMRAFGPAEWAVRLPALLSTWATWALTVWFSRRLLGPSTAWVAGTAFATSLLTMTYAHTVIFDSLLTFFTTVALIALYFAMEEESDSTGRVWSVVAWAAIAGGNFTKGPVALLIPVLVAVPFALWRRRVTRVFDPLALLVFLALVIPWLVFTERAMPGFLHYSLVTETWERLTTGKMQRTGPPWYFLPILLGGVFPWSILPLAAGWSRVRGALKHAMKPRLIFLGLWIALPLIFFSLSQSKRFGYVLPLVPALALLAAGAWSVQSARRRIARIVAAGWMILGAVFLIAAREFEPNAHFAYLAPLIVRAASTLALVMVLSAIVGWSAVGRRRLGPVVMSLPLLLTPVLAAPVMDGISEVRSGRAMAAAAAPTLTESTVVIGVESYSPSLAYYLGRPILLSTADGVPLRSNYALELYPRVVGRNHPTLQPEGAWLEALTACTQPSLFLLSRFRRDEKAMLSAAGVPRIFENEKFALMGPCR